VEIIDVWMNFSALNINGFTWAGYRFTWAGYGFTWAGYGFTWAGYGFTWVGYGFTWVGYGLRVCNSRTVDDKHIINIL
jgi:hypothetical protein